MEATQPVNNLVKPFLTDMYQISMVYAYWKNGHHNDHAVFDAFFRKCPFKGEFTIFAGLDEVLKFISTWKVSEEELEYVSTIIPNVE
jgi:nicotinate phosphoribosyltransferase